MSLSTAQVVEKKQNGKLLSSENPSSNCHPHCIDENDIGNNIRGKKGCEEDSRPGRKKPR
jgi:hypothetical protein